MVREHVLATYGPATPSWSEAAVKAAVEDLLAPVGHQILHLLTRIEALEKLVEAVPQVGK